MLLFNKTMQENPQLTVRSFLRSSDSDAEKIILFDIVKEIINLSEFACSIVDYDEDEFEEIFVRMENSRDPEYLSLDSKEFVTAVYFLGLSKGVKLDEDDIFEITGEVSYQVSMGGLSTHIVEKSHRLTEVTA